MSSGVIGSDVGTVRLHRGCEATENPHKAWKKISLHVLALRKHSCYYNVTDAILLCDCVLCCTKNMMYVELHVTNSGLPQLVLITCMYMYM